MTGAWVSAAVVAKTERVARALLGDARLLGIVDGADTALTLATISERYLRAALSGRDAVRGVLAVVAVIGAFLINAGASAAAASSNVLSILVVGDSYSAGNGAGDYTGDAGCYQSKRNYAWDFARLVEAAPYHQPANVTNVACSGATTSWFFNKEHNRPPEIDAVNNSYNLIFLTIGGDDIDFADIVQYCLVEPFAVGDHCLANLDRAVTMLTDHTVQNNVTNVLSAIRQQAAPNAKIVLLGYPYLIRNKNYELIDRREGKHSVQGDACGQRQGKTNVVTVGRCLTEIGDLGDTLQQGIVNQLNSQDHTTAFVFVKMKSLFEGPPNHELAAPIARFSAAQPKRWFIQPYYDTALIDHNAWYHPNPTGWLQEAKRLLSDPSVPKHPPSVSVNVSNPGDQTGTVGTPTDLQIQASDTDGGTITYSATGLPAGLSIDPASGLITGVPMNNGTSKVSISATDSSGPHGNTTFIWTVAPVIVPASGPALVYTGYTVGHPDAGDTSFTDFSQATGQDADVVDTLPTTLSGYRCAVLVINTYVGAGDVSVLQAFLNAGGTVLALGEHSGSGWDNADSALSGLAASLGASGLSLNDDSYDDGDSQTTAIASSPLTAGVGTLDDNWVSSLTVNNPATTLVYTADDDTLPLVAYQQIGAGTFVLSGDSNMFNDNNDGFYENADNGQFAEALCP